MVTQTQHHQQSGQKLVSFITFASYNVTVNRVVQNTIQVLADIDPVGSPSKPLHSHHNLYFQDITFGDVGVNGSYKNKAGWETLIGCDNSVFYNVKTVSYNKKQLIKTQTRHGSNLQYCNNLIFQGTTMESLGAYTDKMNAAMSPIVVTDNKVTAENVVPSDEKIMAAMKSKVSMLGQLHLQKVLVMHLMMLLVKEALLLYQS